MPERFWRCWFLLNGGDPIFLGYGHILTLLPLLGLLIVVGRLLWRGPLKPSQRLLDGAILAAALVLALSPLVVSAGTIPSRALIAWIPISAFLAGVALSFSGRFEKLLYGALAAALFISIWVSVSLFYTDHLARQRDQFLAARIMTRVDNILPNPPPGRIPFVVVGAVPAKADGPFRKLEIFGDSFFDASHEGGNPWRVAAYLRTLGVDTLEPHPLSGARPIPSRNRGNARVARCRFRGYGQRHAGYQARSPAANLRTAVSFDSLLPLMQQSACVDLKSFAGGGLSAAVLQVGVVRKLPND